MKKTDEIVMMMKVIIEAHNGQAYFNYEESSKIVGCGRHTLARGLYEAGILVKKVGPSKRVSAYDLALYMVKSRKAPIDNVT